MVLGDGIRRNIAKVDPDERRLLKRAILEMHRRFYPGNRNETPPGGVSWWFKQDEIHQATHVHGGPEFLPWHRELTNRFEDLLRQILIRKGSGGQIDLSRGHVCPGQRPGNHNMAVHLLIF
jgi:hypothetical protein